MNRSTLKKSIDINEETYHTIEKRARMLGKSFSEFITDAALERIAQDDALPLSAFLNKYCDPISDEEQKEIDGLNLDYDSNDYEELAIGELL